MEDYLEIRKRVLRDNESQRKVAKELGHSRNTVAKVIKNSEPPGYRRTKPIKYPVTGPYTHIIDAWLEEDAGRPKKQKHTAKQIFKRLKKDHNYKGGYTAVKRYVKKRKKTTGEKYFPLYFGPGEEAQVDWGESWIEENGKMKKVQKFCMRMCYSKASFVRLYKKANLESFLDGHVKAFKYYEGVPGRIAYDNLKSAVIQVLKGKERKLTKKFEGLMSHYLFDARFCNIRKGNEKGHVENLVKYARQNFMVPIPQVVELEELNKQLLIECKEDLDRKIEREGKTCREMLDEEKEYFLAIPCDEYDACVIRSTFPTKQGLVRFDTNDYSVPIEWAQHSIVLKGYVDKVKIYRAGESVAEHKRSYGNGDYILNFRHYIPLLRSKWGGIYNGRPFMGEPWGKDFTRLRKELEYRYGGEGTKMFVSVLLLFMEYNDEQVKEAVRTCISRRVYSDEAVKNVLRYEPYEKTKKLDLAGRPELSGAGNWERSAEIYDSLIYREKTNE